MKKIIFFIVGYAFVFQIYGQNTNRVFKSFEDKNSFYQVNVNDGLYRIHRYSPTIVETTFIPKGDSYNSSSHTVTLKENLINTIFIENEEEIIIITDGIKVKIQKQPFQISYSYKGKPIISEKRGYYKSAHNPMDLVKDNIVAEETEKIEFNLTNNEVLYGGGARALGTNRRGHRLPLYNRAHYGYETHSELMNYTMPIVLSSKKYMIHFDNAPIGYLDLDSKKDNTLTYETISGRKTYQVIVGDSWYDLMDNYTYLTGKQPMLPRWALGNFSSRFGYHSQYETEATIDKFKEENIPVDAIILDLYWFGKEVKGTMGNLKFYRDSFPSPNTMIKNLRNKNVETILITEPFILTTSNRWDEAVKENILAKDSIGNPARYDFYFGNTGIIDIYGKNGNYWFKNRYKNLSKLDITGFWGDLGEPEVHPNWVQHTTGSADEVHNIYGHDWAKLVYEASLEANPNLRPFILMRAGYSGSQRYGLIPWSGDVNRTWGGFQPQVDIALQMSMQGLAYMHSDLGGFAGVNLDDELYVRWLQYGVFNPIYRPHAQEDVASEPVFRSDKAKQLAKFAIQMRYKMLPYNYNLMAENHIKGTPLMRPLFFEEADNPELFDYSEAYLWGNDILVSPVLEAGKKEQDVYFPKTSNWFDIENDKLIEGGQTKTVALNESFIPTYVRAGAFIPLAKPMQSTKEYNVNELELHYYFDNSIKESERKLYIDDGKTVKPIEKNQYQILEFEAEKEKRNRLEIELEAETASNYKSQIMEINLVLHNIQKQPKQIKIGKKRVNGSYNETYKTLTLNITWDTAHEKKIKIKLGK